MDKLRAAVHGARPVTVHGQRDAQWGEIQKTWSKYKSTVVFDKIHGT